MPDLAAAATTVALPVLDATQSTLVAAGAALLALVALVVAIGAQLRLRRVRRGFRVLRGHSGDGDVLEVATRHAAEVSLLRDQVDQQQAEVERLSADVAAGLRHVAVVRYDAFGDMGGHLSFSAAILDDAGDGIVLTAIHGRAESRTYAKGLIGGASAQTLSPEEVQAVRAARQDTGTRDSGRAAASARRAAALTAAEAADAESRLAEERR